MPQILTPYGYTNDEAGYVTVAFIVAGIVGAVSSGLVIDKFRVHKLILKTFVPILGFMYLALLMVGMYKKSSYCLFWVIDKRHI